MILILSIKFVKEEKLQHQNLECIRELIFPKRSTMILIKLQLTNYDEYDAWVLNAQPYFKQKLLHSAVWFA